MKVKYYGLTDIGCVRKVNEDYFILHPVLNGEYILGCIADGVGSNPGGDIASRLAAETISSYISQTTGNESLDDIMFSAVVAANNAIIDQHSNPYLSNMSCVLTAVMLNISNGEMHISHCGDTRLYIKQGAKMYKVTNDHSIIGPLEENGKLTEKQAMRHPHRNLLTRSIGNRRLSYGSDYIQSIRLKINPPCSIYLCSDGMYDMITSSETCAILSSDMELPEKVNTLVEAAKAAGGKDNITAIVLEINN